MNLSLVGSQMSNDASCEESSVHEGAGYDEAFGSGNESEDSSIPSERETSTQSPNGDESFAKGDKDEERRDGDNGDEMDVDSDGDEGSSEGTLEGPGDNRPFILPEDWAINKFLSRMSGKVFRELRICYQIPDHIPIRLPSENERSYSGRTADVGMYDAMFAAGLRLPLTVLHRQLADFLGISVT